MKQSKLAKALTLKSTLGVVDGLKSDLSKQKKQEVAALMATRAYESGPYITQLVAFAKAQKVLNHVKRAVREGRAELGAADVEKLREIVGEALSSVDAARIVQPLLASAYNEGRREYQMEHDTRPFLMIVTMRDGRVRDEHDVMDGITLPKADPFWKRFYPPFDFGCRCKVIALTQAVRDHYVKVSKRVKTDIPQHVEALMNSSFEGPFSVKAENLRKHLVEKMRKFSQD